MWNNRKQGGAITGLQQAQQKPKQKAQGDDKCPKCSGVEHEIGAQIIIKSVKDCLPRLQSHNKLG